MTTLSNPSRDTWIVTATIAACAILLTIKYFPGVESSPWYSGFILRAIEDTLLGKDPIVGDLIPALSPYKLTAYYLLPKIFGEIWLDDRFVLPFYLATVAASFYFVDRIAVRLGARNIFLRLSVLLLFLRDHQISEGVVNFAHHPDFHHSALALPLSLWVLYIALVNRPLWQILAAGLVLAAVSLQVAPFTLGIALTVVVFIGRPLERKIAMGISVSGVVLCAVFMAVYFNFPGNTRIDLWNDLIHGWYEGMAAPFDTSYNGLALTVYWSIALAVILLVAMLWPAPTRMVEAAMVRGVRIIAFLSFVIWIVLGLYAQFAPDSLKYPPILLFPVSRQLQAPQVITMIAGVVLVLQWAAAQPDLKRSATAMVFMLFMVVTGPGNFGTWAGLFALSLGVAFVALETPVARYIPEAPRMAAQRPIGVITIAMILTMSASMAAAAYQNRHNWTQMFTTGIYGGSGAAKWANIAPYLRANTPSDSVVLAMTAIGYQGEQELSVDRNIVSRSGRAAPYPIWLSKGLDYSWFQFTKGQEALHIRITKGWDAGNSADVQNALDGLQPKPDYIVVPSEFADRIGPDLRRSKMTEMDGYTIFRLGLSK